MSKVQLPGSFRFDSHIRMHTGTENKDVSLAQEFKDNLEEEHRQNGAIYQGKKKRFMERKWKEIKYHFKDNAAMELKDVRMYCNTNKFPELPFCGPHSKPHVARGLSIEIRFKCAKIFFNLIEVNIKPTL